MDEQKPISWPVLQILACLLQMIPLFILTFVIVTTPSLPVDTRYRSNQRVFGPSKTSKFILVLALLSIFFWFEPSIMYRMLDSLWDHPKSESLCIVPPWWWIENGTTNFLKIKGIPTHGWASVIDILQWIAGFGLYCYFFFMKSEYTRNMEDWIWVTVSEVQNTFDFRRY